MPGGKSGIEKRAKLGGSTQSDLTLASEQLKLWLYFKGRHNCYASLGEEREHSEILPSSDVLPKL